MPAAKTAAKISELINNLSKTYQTAAFSPHITLLSGITDSEEIALQKLKNWTALLQPIQAELTSIAYLELYYKCLFFNAAGSEELLIARQEAEELFTHTNIQPFIPHISFLYGNLPIFKKQEIISELGATFLHTILLDKIQLVKTERTVEEWRVLAEIELK